MSNIHCKDCGAMVGRFHLPGCPKLFVHNTDLLAGAICVVCAATAPRTGTCSGSHDPRSLCAVSDGLKKANDSGMKHTGEAAFLARRFHQTYERLAPNFGYKTRPDTKVFDAESPNGKLMIAVCAEVFGLPSPLAFAEREKYKGA